MRRPGSWVQALPGCSTVPRRAGVPGGSAAGRPSLTSSRRAAATRAGCRRPRAVRRPAARPSRRSGRFGRRGHCSGQPLSACNPPPGTRSPRWQANHAACRDIRPVAGVPPATPQAVPGKSSDSWMAQICSCWSGGVDPGWITHGDPAGRRRGARREDGADLDDPVDPHLAACSQDTAGEQGSTGGQEAPVAGVRPVQVRAVPLARPGRRSTDAGRGRVPARSPSRRAGADPDLAVLGGEHGSEKNAGVRSDTYRTADDRSGCDVSARMDLRGAASMLNQHRHSLPGAAPGWHSPSATPGRRQIRALARSGRHAGL